MCGSSARISSGSLTAWARTLATSGTFGARISTAASASAITSAAGAISAQWKGAETGSRSARLAPLPLAISTARSTAEPTQLADRIYAEAETLLIPVAGEGPFRLLGVGLSDLVSGTEADTTGDLLDPQGRAREAAERATDAIRARFGKDAIIKGRALR